MKKTVEDLLTRMHHIGVMVRDVDEAVEHYQSLGIGPFGPSNLAHVDREVHGKPAPDVQNLARVTTLGPIGFEVVQAISGESVQQEFLERRGEGINHTCFVVDDIHEAIAVMAKAGFKPISYANNVGGGGVAYFDTDKVGGVQIELEQLPPHLDDDPYWGLKPWLQSAPQTG